MKWFKRKKQEKQEVIDKAIDYKNKLDEAGDYLVEISKTYINKYCETHPNFIGTDRKDKDILFDITDKKDIIEKTANMHSYRLFLLFLRSTHQLYSLSPYLNGVKFKYIRDNVYFDIEDVFVTDVEDRKILCIKIKEALQINKDDILDEIKVL